jgi:hypothetical protein
MKGHAYSCFLEVPLVELQTTLNYKTTFFSKTTEKNDPGTGMDFESGNCSPGF